MVCELKEGADIVKGRGKDHKREGEKDEKGECF